MSDERKCGQCNAPLSPGAPEGLCPACLLKRGFETQTAPGAPASDFTPPPPEDLARDFPQLEILELLGRGGMGVVYKARQRDLDRIVALKILPATTDRDPAFAERFAREARALARLGHPNIVAIYESGQTGGLYYFVMEYVDGLNLRQLLASAKMTPREALAIVPQICEALQTAHDQGIVHRDIKPENILLDKKGRVKIADFGIAKIVGGEDRDMALTGVGEMVGTPAYMAPEQIEHPRDVDHRADIYSLGVVFYQMLTGELPLGKFAPPSRKVQIDIRLDEVVMRALEKEPALRYQHASEVKTRVETIVSSPRPRDDSGSPAPAGKSITPEALDQLRWKLIVSSVPLAIAAIAAGYYLAVYVQQGAGIAMGAWGVLFSGAIIILAATGRGNFERIRAAAQLTIIDSIGIIAVVMWLAWNTTDLLPPWRVCLILMFGYMIVSGCLKLACVWPYGRGLWAADSREKQPMGYAALYFACLSGLIPTLFYWLRPWTAPWLSAEGQNLMIWATLWVGICAVVLGLGARRSRVGRYAIIVGSINLTIWMLFFVAGQVSSLGAGAGAHPELLQDETTDIQPDGTAHYVVTSSAVNASSSPVYRDDFNSSNNFHLEKLTDANGRPMHFETTAGAGDLYHYSVTLNEPVPPGGRITETTEGTALGLALPMRAPREFQYSFDHSPGYNGVTRRIETHRLPPGAELIDKSPEDLTVKNVGDHIELHIDREIPAGGDLSVRFHYRLEKQRAASKPADFGPETSGSQMAPSEQILAEYDWKWAPGESLLGEHLAYIGYPDGHHELRIQNTTDQPLNMSLMKIDKPPVTSMNYALTGEIRYEGVQGVGYLGMSSYFSPLHPGLPEQKFFSGTYEPVGSGPMGQIAGRSDWRTFAVPFDIRGPSTTPPTRLEFSIFLAGRGTVLIGPLKLTQLVKPKEVVINVRTDGSIVFNRQLISGEELVARLRELGKRFPDQAVVLRGDENANYESFDAVLDLCRQANIWNVAFAMQPASQPSVSATGQAVREAAPEPEPSATSN